MKDERIVSNLENLGIDDSASAEIVAALHTNPTEVQKLLGGLVINSQLLLFEDNDMGRMTSYGYRYGEVNWGFISEKKILGIPFHKLIVKSSTYGGSRELLHGPKKSDPGQLDARQIELINKRFNSSDS